MTDYIKNILVSEAEISELCDRIAEQITEDYKDSDKRLVLICILKGSLMFTSELMKRISLPLEVDFMKVSSYGSNTVSSGYINIHLDIKRVKDANAKDELIDKAIQAVNQPDLLNNLSINISKLAFTDSANIIAKEVIKLAKKYKEEHGC